MNDDFNYPIQKLFSAKIANFISAGKGTATLMFCIKKIPFQGVNYTASRLVFFGFGDQRLSLISIFSQYAESKQRKIVFHRVGGVKSAEIFAQFQHGRPIGLLSLQQA